MPTHITKRHLQVDGVFTEISLAASADYALELIETDARGEIHVDRNGRPVYTASSPSGTSTMAATGR